MRLVYFSIFCLLPPLSSASLNPPTVNPLWCICCNCVYHPTGKFRLSTQLNLSKVWKSKVCLCACVFTCAFVHLCVHCFVFTWQWSLKVQGWMVREKSTWGAARTNNSAMNAAEKIILARNKIGWKTILHQSHKSVIPSACASSPLPSTHYQGTLFFLFSSPLLHTAPLSVSLWRPEQDKGDSCIEQEMRVS